MRYGPEHRQETHQRVLEVAAREIREHGPEGVSVAALMKEAGLTHGGFYAHFASKDALVAESITYMFDETWKRIDKVICDKEPHAALVSYIDYYLSSQHCSTRNTGCPIAALGSDVPRLDTQSKQAFVQGLMKRRQRLENLLKNMGMENPEIAAHSLGSELLGALMIARLMDAKDRDAFLAESRKALHYRFQ